MAALLRGNLVGACDGEIPACPQADVVRQRSSGAVHEIGDGLNAGKLHAVAGFLLILVLDFFFRRIAGKETLDHKL